MGYLLTDFCADARSVLSRGSDRDSRGAVRAQLERLLVDPEFCAEYVSASAPRGMRQIYQDEATGFCVLAYNMTEPRQSPPHDHGRSWAVYGQATGYTDMTIWTASGPGGRIEPDRQFRLNAGEAGLFDVRDIHSIDYGAGARFVRVTGVDMSGEPRRVFDPATGAAREVESVGAGPAKPAPPRRG